MSNIVDFAQYVNDAISAGEVVEGNVIRIVSDNGQDIGEAVVKEIQAGNGVASTLFVGVQTALASAKATGLAYLAMEVGTLGAAVAPALGITAGIGLYNMSPEFWTNVSNALIRAGKTVGGKVISYWNGENLYLDEEVIEIFKNALVEAGAFDIKAHSNVFDIAILNNDFIYAPLVLEDGKLVISYIRPNAEIETARFTQNQGSHITYFLASDTFPQRPELRYIITSTQSFASYEYHFEYDDKTVYYTVGTWLGYSGYTAVAYSVATNSAVLLDALGHADELAWIIEYGTHTGNQDNLQSDATYPNENPFPLTYPDWYPLQYDPILNPSELPTIYPIKYPEIDPDPYPKQDPAQDPDPEEDPEIYPNIIPDFDLPEPNPNLDPDRDPDDETDPDDPYDPEEDPDPDPTPVDPDPDPIPNPDPYPDDVPDPIDPNPDPIVDPTQPLPVTPDPDTASSNKLFTVYNPSGAQLDALGGYLWDSNLVEILKKLWQNPLDGVISLIQVYVTPTTGGSSNIMLGYLDSGVSAPVVSNQFVTVECGTVQLKENKKNATDYAPYTSLHLFLPFIGIVELDVNECMNGSITVTYKVDVYTGTCLALVKITRTKDMPNPTILYQFSGNCAQQLPLTSGDATGMLASLVSGVGAGLAIASGGGLGVVAGAHMIGNSLTHEMFHVSHSGNISANAGILGGRKPYLIIGRRHGYDANAYNTFYGYPSNKTVVIGNYSGFIKTKTVHLETKATKNEASEIEALLSSGVIL